MKNILIFGGTFDPIHKGHIQVALKVQEDFNFDSFLFLPCKIPSLKANAKASVAQRLDMLKLALKEFPNPAFGIDTRELDRESSSYTLITLRSYRKELGEKLPLTFLLGEDSFFSFPFWENFEELPKLANLLVVSREEQRSPMPKEIKELLKIHETHDKERLLCQPSGYIYQYHAGSYRLSSTAIREKIKNGEESSLDVPESVLKYIQEHKIYQPTE